MKSGVLAFSYIDIAVKSQGQTKVIIRTIFEAVKYPMLHAKCQDHRSNGSGEEDFWCLGLNVFISIFHNKYHILQHAIF